MKILIASGNTRLLDAIKSELALQSSATITDSTNGLYAGNDNDVVMLTSSYEDLKAVSADQAVLTGIVVIHDSDNPFDTHGTEPGYFFNEFRQAKPGEFLGDCYMELKPDSISDADLKKSHCGVRYSDVMKSIGEFMKEHEIHESLINGILDGSICVNYDRWSFSGGRGEDCHIFRLEDWDDEYSGTMRLGIEISHDLDIELQKSDADNQTEPICYSNTGMYARNNAAAYEIIYNALPDILKRDDPEIAAVIVKDGTLYLPEDYNDITRKEVLGGAPAGQEVISTDAIGEQSSDGNDILQIPEEDDPFI